MGPSPPAGTPLPDATVAGVTAAQSRSEIAISFAGADAAAAYGRLAGRRVLVTCTRFAAPTLFVNASRPALFAVQAPQQPGTLRLNVGAGRFATCSLSVAPGAPVVQVAVGDPGRAPLEDGLSVQALAAVAQRAAGDGSGGYGSAQSVATSLADATVVLAAPSD